MTKDEQLTQLRLDLEAAAGQLPLTTSASDIVHGEGSVTAQVLFIGEAPGYYEHVQRRPFVGRSGQLLRATLTAVGLDPTAVYISNIVKARPPDNRDPSPAEIAAYKPFLDREINLIQPQLICTLGRFSMAKFLPSVYISQVHGRLHRVVWSDTQQYIYPCYHPAAALRSTQVKTSFEQDLSRIPKILEWVEQQNQTEVLSQQVVASMLS